MGSTSAGARVCKKSPVQSNVQSHEYVTRRATEGRFLLPNAKNNFLRHIVLYRAMKSWNFLPRSLIRITRKKDFRRQVKAHRIIVFIDS